MKKINDKIVFVDDKGNQTSLTLYFTYHSESNNKTYVFFYDELMPQEIIAGILLDDGTVIDVETDEEYDELDKIVDEYIQNEENSKK